VPPVRVIEQRRRLTAAGAAAWTIAVAVLLELAISVTEAARPGAFTDLVNITACHMLSYSVVVLVMLRVYEPETSVRDVVALRSPGQSALAAVAMLGLGAVIGACVYPALSALEALVALRYPPSSEEIDALRTLTDVPSLGRRAFLGASLIVLTPVADEVFFRGVLFGGLRRAHRAGYVILGTALCFAFTRADVRSFASVLALGVILGWLRERSGSILTTLAAQVAFFAVPVVPILGGRDPMSDEVFPRAWIGGGVAVALVAALVMEVWWRRRRNRLNGLSENDGGQVHDA
jgi:membrane protease YdiL (CAAX protease family)